MPALLAQTPGGPPGGGIIWIYTTAGIVGECVDAAVVALGAVLAVLLAATFAFVLLRRARRWFGPLLLLLCLASDSVGAAARCYWAITANGADLSFSINVHWDSGLVTTVGPGDSLPLGCNVSGYTYGGPDLGDGIDARINLARPSCGGAGAGFPSVAWIVTGAISEGDAIPGWPGITCGACPNDCSDCGPGTDDIDCDEIDNEDDGDIDGDGIPNEIDPDIDGDGIPNDEDDDDDGDGEPDDEDDDPCGSDGLGGIADPCSCAPESPACNPCDPGSACCPGEPGYPECEDDCDPMSDCCPGEEGYPTCCDPETECCPEEEGYPDCEDGGEPCDECVCDKLESIEGILANMQSQLDPEGPGGYTPVMPPIPPVPEGSPPDDLDFEGAENVLPGSLPEFGSPTGGQVVIPVPGVSGEGVTLRFGARPLEDFAQTYLPSGMLGTAFLAIDTMRQAVRLVLLLFVSWSFCRRVYAVIFDM